MVMLVRARNHRKVFADQSGAAAVEFAIIGPMLVVLLIGILSYGGYFWLSHSLQQLANDAARVAIGGLTQTERQQLASQAMTSELTDYPFMKAQDVTATVTGDDQVLSVAVAYDATKAPFWIFQGLVPLPSATITRSATVRLGGY
ncbi:MAG: pilus assembly protein [Caulobacterales bacterium]|nr:pilus assembly protein [Caulobacterales bacterium]